MLWLDNIESWLYNPSLLLANKQAIESSYNIVLSKCKEYRNMQSHLLSSENIELIDSIEPIEINNNIMTSLFQATQTNNIHNSVLLLGQLSRIIKTVESSKVDSTVTDNSNSNSSAPHRVSQGKEGKENEDEEENEEEDEEENEKDAKDDEYKKKINHIKKTATKLVNGIFNEKKDKTELESIIKKLTGGSYNTSNDNTLVGDLNEFTVHVNELNNMNHTIAHGDNNDKVLVKLINEITNINAVEEVINQIPGLAELAKNTECAFRNKRLVQSINGICKSDTEKADNKVAAENKAKDEQKAPEGKCSGLSLIHISEPTRPY